MRIISEGSVDGVVVATPPDTHEHLATAAARAGMTVICDKPLAGSVAAAERMVSVAGTLGFVTFQWRLHPVVRALRALHGSGSFGELLHIDLEFHHDFLSGASTAWPWRHSRATATAGTLADQGVHLFDLLRFVTGAEWRVSDADCSVAWNQRTHQNSVISCETEDIAQVRLASGQVPSAAARVLASRVTFADRAIRVRALWTSGTAEAAIDVEDGSAVLRIAGRTTGEWQTTRYAAQSMNPYPAILAALNETSRTDVPALFADGLAAQRMLSDCLCSRKDLN